MNRYAVLVTITCTLAATGIGVAQTGAPPADALIIQANSHAELHDKFCAANPNIEHIVVLPAALFVDSQQVLCEGGSYKLYRLIEPTDTDDFEYFLDPPLYAKGSRLACDGKAGLAMQTVSINCRPLTSPLPASPLPANPK